MAEIVAIGVSGIFAEIFSTKRYLSLQRDRLPHLFALCAFCAKPQEMIICRALQGLTGGALIPLAFNINPEVAAAAKQPDRHGDLRHDGDVRPAIGPTIGGWLTDNYGWQWIFFINLVPGLGMIALIWIFLPCDEMHLEKLSDIDYLGVISMAIGLGSLEYVLEEGERKDWFGNEIILRCAWIAAIFIPLFLIRELTARNPFLNLGVFLNRNFSASCVMMVAQGVGLYGSVFFLPLYLGQDQGYSPTLIGLTMMWVGLPQLLIIPFIPKILKLVDVRLVIGLGILLFAGSCYMNAFMDPDYSGPQLATTNIMRAFGQPLVLIPLLSVATATIPKRDSGSASSIFNMLRNLGGSVGIALLSTLLTWREHLHSQRIVSTVTPETLAGSARLEQMQQMFLLKGLDPATAERAAIRQLGSVITRQASIMAYADCFWMIAVILFGSGLALFLLPRIKPGNEAHAA